MSMYDNFDKEQSHPDFGDVETDGMQQYGEYQAMGVDNIITDITELSNSLINTTCDFYLSNSEMFNENDRNYINAIKGSERNNLQVLLKQVKYVEHILDNLMRQLDNGGFMDSGIYTTIQEMQKSSMEITMQVSKYTRNLPDYFKYVKMDIEQSKEQEELKSNGYNNTNSISGNQPHNQLAIDGEVVGGDDRFDKPYRGVRALLMDLENEESSLEKAIENSKNSTPKQIIIEDDIQDIEVENEDVDDFDA